MMIVKTCPKCGHDLTDLVLTSFPSIHGVRCFHCGYEHFNPQEELIRVPYCPQYEKPHMDEMPILNGGYDVCIGAMQIMTNEAVIHAQDIPISQERMFKK